MATTIKITVVNATINNGVAVITLEFDDGKGKWQKTYDYQQTTAIDFASFKDKVVADLKKDLQVKDQLSNITAQIGKSFTITI